MMKNIKCKKVLFILVCLVSGVSSCQNYYDYSDLSYECAPFNSYDWLYNLVDYVYLIELGEMLGTWTSPNKSLGSYGTYDIWAYSVIETYKGTSDKYYMFFNTGSYIFESVPDFITGSNYYVFLKDYSYLDKRSGFPDYFLAPNFCSSAYSIYPA